MTFRLALLALLSMPLITGACGSRGEGDFPELLPMDTLLAEPDLPAHAATDPDAVTQSLNSAATALAARAAALAAQPAPPATDADTRATDLQARAAALRAASTPATPEDEHPAPPPQPDQN